LNWRPPA